MVHLPGAPFLVGELSPVEVLAPLVTGPVTVDDDVDWAARPERAAAGPEGLDDFVYPYLGEGLGGAVVVCGAWGTHPAVLQAVSDRAAALPRHVRPGSQGSDTLATGHRRGSDEHPGTVHRSEPAESPQPRGARICPCAAQPIGHGRVPRP
ncbi:ROK family protein [Geodermatophilus dictyosporus]|uniref:ROK family protein n=1 Tax=Geodermatophilus dictyosporus TaxID=1523247 RepID=UPI00145C1C6D|nr:ROK family protein [Geodermatophilus dictyosporus]